VFDNDLEDARLFRGVLSQSIGYVITRLGFGAQMVHIDFLCELISLVSRLFDYRSNPARGIMVTIREIGILAD